MNGRIISYRKAISEVPKGAIEATNELILQGVATGQIKLIIVGSILLLAGQPNRGIRSRGL